MKDNDQLFDIEKTIGGYMRKSADNPAPPPFAGIAGRIAAGQPAESFEAFFGGDIPGQCSFQAAPVRSTGGWTSEPARTWTNTGRFPTT